MDKFIILCRYESWTDNGKDWSKWFVRDSKPRSLGQALQRIVSLKVGSAQTDKVTKLKHEFKALSVKNGVLTMQ